MSLKTPKCKCVTMLQITSTKERKWFRVLFEIVFLLIHTVIRQILESSTWSLGIQSSLGQLVSIVSPPLFGHTARHAELLQLGIKPRPPAVDTQSINHWTTREVLHCFVCSLKTAGSPIFLAPGTSFMEDSFPGARGGYEFQDDSNTLHLLCTLFLLLLHQLHLRSPGIRSWRFGNHCLKGKQTHHKSNNRAEQSMGVILPYLGELLWIIFYKTFSYEWPNINKPQLILRHCFFALVLSSFNRHQGATSA